MTIRQAAIKRAERRTEIIRGRCVACDARLVPAFDDMRRVLCSACVRACISPAASPWVARALASTLPAKELRR
jgi:hypothetical protein